MKQVRLALSGSGFLAPIHAGAVCALYELGYSIVELAGTSGGSIVAAYAAMGATADRLRALSSASLPSGIASVQVSAMLFGEALNSGAILSRWLGNIFSDATFGQTRIPLHVVATDINAGKSFTFDETNSPDVRLADACRASASIPFFYEPAHVRGVKYLDGGMCCNLPVDKLVVDAIPRLGIEVVDSSAPGSTDGALDFMKACVSTMLSANEGNLVAWGAQTGATILPVSAAPYSFLDAELPLAAKGELFSRGYYAVKQWAVGHA